MYCAKISCDNLKIENILDLREFQKRVKDIVPTGFKKRKIPLPHLVNSAPMVGGVIHREIENASHQIGTLGGGNHFIELQADEEENLYIMIHSGSRNIGKQVAEFHHKVAKSLMKKWYVDVPTDLSFLPTKTIEGLDYLREMEWCVEYAKKNRAVMMGSVMSILSDMFDDVDILEEWDVAHNYARLENHFGKNVLVHRKGATRAYKGQIGIIPGSQGSYSYLVEGKGSIDSFMSCSHGAGRTMSRTKAKNTLNREEEIAKMEGVVHDLDRGGSLDEAPGAYKDISKVMANQSDLVKIVKELRPLVSIKA